MKKPREIVPAVCRNAGPTKQSELTTSGQNGALKIDKHECRRCKPFRPYQHWQIIWSHQQRNLAAKRQRCFSVKNCAYWPRDGACETRKHTWRYWRVPLPQRSGATEQRQLWTTSQHDLSHRIRSDLHRRRYRKYCRALQTTSPRQPASESIFSDFKCW